MEKITAEEALELSVKAHELRNHFDNILSWVFQMIRQNAKEGYTASRLNLKEKKQFFDKHTGEGWGTEIDYWSLIIERLTKELQNEGFKISTANSDDYHIHFR